jgi:hypothetical protein
VRAPHPARFVTVCEASFHQLAALLQQFLAAFTLRYCQMLWMSELEKCGVSLVIEARLPTGPQRARKDTPHESGYEGRAVFASVEPGYFE